VVENDEYILRFGDDLTAILVTNIILSRKMGAHDCNTPIKLFGRRNEFDSLWQHYFLQVFFIGPLTL
jgi:hypothetical protein